MGKHTESNSDKFYKLINIALSDALNENEIVALIKLDPTVCAEKYPIESISLEFIYPLHALCSLPGASLSLIKKVYKAYPDALYDATSQIGNPIHYCCTFNVNTSLDIINFLCTKTTTNDNDTTLELLLQTTNLDAERTPLHLACCYCSTNNTNDDNNNVSSFETVAYLTEKYPNACQIQDCEGCTPLVSFQKIRLCIIF